MNFWYYDKKLVYPDASNQEFHPDCAYPEYPYGSQAVSKTPNKVYEAIRTMLYEMGLGAERYGTKEWNPLGKWIRPGQKVLLKPNFVNHRNESDQPDDLESLVTHPSIIRCLLDYCYIALQGEGSVIVGDAPVKDCDFNLLMNRGRYIEVEKFFHKISSGFHVQFYDFRGPEEEGGQYNDTGRGVVVNLGKKSWFYQCGYDEEKYRVPNYDYRLVVRHHKGEVQEYMVNSAVLEADVVISIPKPKTHRKNGYTAALKNFVGINYSKEYLPHHTEGSVSSGGDEYIQAGVLPFLSSRIRRCIDINRVMTDGKNAHKNTLALRFSRKMRGYMWRAYWFLYRIDQRWSAFRGVAADAKAREGTWHGNDTLWRTVLDLNYVLRYARADGKVMDQPQRTILHLGDMVVSGEKEGPMSPSPKEQHMMLFSDDAVEFDCIVAKVMGFDYNKLAILNHAVGFKPLTKLSYNDIEVQSNDEQCAGSLRNICFEACSRPFIATEGWRGHIELKSP